VSDPFSEESVTNLREAHSILEKINEEIHSYRQQRLETASEEARNLYISLSHMPPLDEDVRFAPIFELRKLGLLKTLEDI
jgi:Icc-related predicted phosphoesterase